MKSFLIFACFIQAHALIEWPFTMTDGGIFNLNLTVGNPPQSVLIGFGVGEIQDAFGQDQPGLYLLKPNDFNSKKGFMPSKSSTFKKFNTIKVDGNQKAVSGSEDVAIESSDGKSVSLKQLPVNVLLNGYQSYGFLSLKRSQNGDTFLEKLLSTQKERNLVIVPGNIPKIDNSKFDRVEHTGQLVLGEKPKNCQNWKYVPEVELESNNNQWNFVIDNVKIGEKTVAKSSNANIMFGSFVFEMPENAYKQIKRELGVNEENIIDCNQTKKFVLTIGGKQLELDQKNYMDKFYIFNYDTPPKPECRFVPVQTNSKNTFVLPFNILRNKCFLLDFQHKQIGFADDVKN